MSEGKGFNIFELFGTRAEGSSGKISYTGVELPKAHNRQNAPNPERYADYREDRFTGEFQQRVAVAWTQGEPFLVEGGTSLGKTTTIRKMCADLGYEVYYVNLNGATDVEDLMGRYVPNAWRQSESDPEYVFIDGQVTAALRQENGKKKVLVLDEYNAAAPNIIIRLHEVLDQLERGGEVVLAEDAGERVPVNKNDTKVVALTNPPGKGYLQREPLDPAQLRRWVYWKAPNELPEESFKAGTRALFGIESGQEEAPPKELKARKEMLSTKELQKIPGIAQIAERYIEFHQAAKKLVTERKIGADQPQPFTYDDREEPRRVNEFVRRFYDGNITLTFQRALRYYYGAKVLDKNDRQKLDELIRQVAYTAPVEKKSA